MDDLTRLSFQGGQNYMLKKIVHPVIMHTTTQSYFNQYFQELLWSLTWVGPLTDFVNVVC